jgi:hypothetical protein
VFLSGTHYQLSFFGVDSRQEHAGMTNWFGFETASILEWLLVTKKFASVEKSILQIKLCKLFGTPNSG